MLSIVLNSQIYANDFKVGFAELPITPDQIDEWIRKFIDNAFEWIQKKNLKLISSFILLIIFGILAQLGIIPKLIT